MHFLSQYSSLASQLFDGHPLGNDSRWIVTQPTWTEQAQPNYWEHYIDSLQTTYDSVD